MNSTYLNTLLLKLNSQFPPFEQNEATHHNITRSKTSVTDPTKQPTQPRFKTEEEEVYNQSDIEVRKTKR